MLFADYTAFEDDGGSLLLPYFLEEVRAMAGLPVRRAADTTCRRVMEQEEDVVDGVMYAMTPSTLSTLQGSILLRSVLKYQKYFTYQRDI